MLGVLVKSGATIRARAMLYKAVVQVVLMYSSEIWVVKYVMIKVLKRLHHHISWRITGNTAQKFREEGWECPLHGGDPWGRSTVANLIVRQAVSDYHWVLHFYTINIRAVHWGWTVARWDSDDMMVGSRPYPDRGGKWRQRRGGGQGRLTGTKTMGEMFSLKYCVEAVPRTHIGG